MKKSRLILIGAILASLWLLATYGPAGADTIEKPAYYIIVGNSPKSLPGNLSQSVAKAGGTVYSSLPQIGVAMATSSNPDFIAAMSGAAGVDAVVPDYFVELPDANANDVGILTHDPIPYAGGTDLDGLLWGLDEVNAPEAWADGVDGSGVRVAVLDAGIDADHPDFASSLNTSLSTSFTLSRPE